MRADLSSRLTAGVLLERLARAEGASVTVDLGREFLLESACKGCGERRPIGRPRHAVFEDDLVCASCRADRRPLDRDPAIAAIAEIASTTAPHVLDLTLEELGVPPLHVLAVRSRHGERWIELTADAARILPGWPAVHGASRTDG